MSRNLYCPWCEKQCPPDSFNYDLDTCAECYEKDKTEFDYWASPEGQAELEEEQRKKEITHKLDLEENYYWYEGGCDDCGAYSACYVKNGKQPPRLRCGCWSREVTDQAEYQRRG